MEAGMRPVATGFLCFVLALSNLSCSVNILSTFADKNTNEALYEDAVSANNAADYNGALSKIALMTGAYVSLPKVLELKASAYAGLCGFVFIPFTQAFAAIGT